jgi:hypothetical protein
MTRIDRRYLDPVLAPKHAALIEDPERGRVLGAVEDEDNTSAEQICGLISREGRVLAWKLPTGERVIYEGEIRVDYNGSLVEAWEPIGKPRIYRVSSDDDAEVAADARRLFLAHSLRTGAASRFAGWRERLVALIPEEVGPKESKIMRTTRDGDVEATHTYTVLDAYGTYAGWVHDLAMEFGSTDEALMNRHRPSGWAESEVTHIVQAWLMREAADAELTQARGSLKLGLGAHARRLKRFDEPGISIAELARSLYTDRPNLSKVVTAAANDERITRLLDAIESGDSNAILAAYRNR